MSIPQLVDSLSAKLAAATPVLVQTKVGRVVLGLVMVGPLTFLPTIWATWTEPNIDALRTLTWPLMTAVNSIGFLSLAHNGDWRMRLATIFWILEMAAVWLAVLVR